MKYFLLCFDAILTMSLQFHRHDTQPQAILWKRRGSDGTIPVRPSGCRHACGAHPQQTSAQDTESPPQAVEKVWTPIPLRSWFWLSLVSFMTLGAIGLEIALSVTNKNQGPHLHRFSLCDMLTVPCFAIGWPTGLGFSLEQGFLHYLYVRLANPRILRRRSRRLVSDVSPSHRGHGSSRAVGLDRY
jgi:hypothetical protein